MMLLLGRGLMFARQILVAPVMIGAWGLSGFGEWMILSAVPAFVTLSNMGVGTASGLDITGYISKKRRNNALTELKRSTIFIGAMGAIVVVLTFILADRFIAEKKLEQINNPVLVVVCLVASSMLYQFQALFQGVWNGFGKSAAGFAAANVYQLGVVVLSIVVPSIKETAELLSAAMLVWTFIWLIVVGGMVLRHVLAMPSGDHVASTSERSTVDLIRIGLGHQLSALWQAIYYQGPLVVISALATSQAVGIWSAFRVMSRAGNQAIDIIGQSGMPEISRQLALKNKAEARSIVMKQLIIASSLALVIGVGFSVLGEWVIHLWTGKTLKIQNYAYVAMGLSYLPYAIWMLLGNVMYASNKPWVINVMATAFATFSMLMAYLLAQHQDVIFGLTISNLIFDVAMAVGVIKLLKSTKIIGD